MIRERLKGIDFDEHGTGTAGIIHSIAPEAKLFSLCVLGRSRDDGLKKLIAGLRFAAEQDSWDIINCSLGTEIDSDEVREICEDSVRRGKIVLAAKDNRQDVNGFPASYDSVIGVDYDHFDSPFDFRYFPDRDIEVEASGIYIEAPSALGGMQTYTGTSFACPQIAGIAARMKEAIPDLDAVHFREILQELRLNR